jgi:hypothetical protein
MLLRRAVLSVMTSVVAGTGLLTAASPAHAASAQVTLKLNKTLIVNYVAGCTHAELSWAASGVGVGKVVATLIDADGTHSSITGASGVWGLPCVATTEFGKWVARVVAYDRTGRVLAQKSSSFYEKGNTRITGFNAGPEPIRHGRTLTVTGSLQHVKFGSAPWYIGYTSQTIRIYFKPSGSTAWAYAGSTATGSAGRFSKHFVARRSGTWRAYFPGTSRYVLTTSSSDFVKVT